MLASSLLGQSKVSGWDLAVAVVAVLVGWWLARLARGVTTRLLGRLEGASPAVTRLTARVVYAFVLAIAIGVAASALGANIAPLQTAAIIVGIVAFVALRGVIGGFASGVVLRTQRPYVIGDHIEAVGYTGIVRDLMTTATVLETYDGRRVHLPNARLVEGAIVNRTALGALRVDIQIRTGNVAPLGDLRRYLLEAVETVPAVTVRPQPLVDVSAHDADRVVWLVRAFVTPTADLIIAAGDIITAMVSALDGRSIPCAAISPPPPPPFTPAAPL